jgi:hypothetical protein
MQNLSQPEKRWMILKKTKYWRRNNVKIVGSYVRISGASKGITPHRRANPDRDQFANPVYFPQWLSGNDKPLSAYRVDRRNLWFDVVVGLVRQTS